MHTHQKQHQHRAHTLALPRQPVQQVHVSRPSTGRHVGEREKAGTHPDIYQSKEQANEMAVLASAMPSCARTHIHGSTKSSGVQARAAGALTLTDARARKRLLFCFDMVCINCSTVMGTPAAAPAKEHRQTRAAAENVFARHREAENVNANVNTGILRNGVPLKNGFQRPGIRRRWEKFENTENGKRRTVRLGSLRCELVSARRQPRHLRSREPPVLRLTCRRLKHVSGRGGAQYRCSCCSCSMHEHCTCASLRTHTSALTFPDCSYIYHVRRNQLMQLSSVTYLIKPTGTARGILCVWACSC